MTEDASAGSEGPGALLARERMARGLTIEELSGRLKYSPRQLVALEADDFAKLPGTTFVRGMIRAYSKHIGCDPQLAIERLERLQVAAPVTVDLRTQRIPFPDGRKKATRIYLVLSSIGVIAVGGVLIDWHFGDELASLFAGRNRDIQTVSVHAAAPLQSESPVQIAPVDSPRDTARAESAPEKHRESPRSGSAPSKIVLFFQKDSWVEITDGSGAVIMSQLNPGGTQRSIEGNPPFALTIGNAHAVKVQFNDENVDLAPHVRVDVAKLTLK